MHYILTGAYYILSLGLGIVVSLFIIKLQVNPLFAIGVGVGVTGFSLAVMQSRKKPDKK